ncbi:MAG: malonate transporter subunit MadM [Rhodothermales bacterium]|nr:malonate transporter subunit MadM [Rhodothermales bacterium]
MTELLNELQLALTSYALVTAFALVGLTVLVSYWFSRRFTAGRVHGSAIAIMIGLAMAYVGGVMTGGSKGVADFPMLAGVGLMGGAMLRDLAIVATAFGVRMEEFRSTGLSGVVSLLAGMVSAFIIGGIVAYVAGYRDAVSVTTIAAGAATFIVGPVTGSALGASSDVIALSIAVGLVKAVVVMIGTPFVAKYIGLDNPRSALIFGGLVGTTSGVAGGLAATDAKLVPYGAMTATFYTGIGCLLGPSLFYMVIRALLGP